MILSQASWVDVLRRRHHRALRQAATYVDRILKGTSPADLPTQATTKFKLFNLKTAKPIGVIIPETLQVHANEVIE